MRNIHFLFILFLIPVISISAQVEFKRTVFIPPDYYIGDAVELRLLLELDDSSELDIPDNYHSHDWIDIKDIIVNQDANEAEIIIHFTSFSPGTRALPELNFGTFIINDFKIYTKSLIEKGESELKGLRPQVLIPGSRLYFILLIAGVLILPYCLYFLIKFLIKNIIIIIKKIHSSRPYRVLCRILKKMDLNLEKTSMRDFFITLSDSIRAYLTARTGFDCISATTSEISMLHGFGLKEGYWDRLLGVSSKMS